MASPQPPRARSLVGLVVGLVGVLVLVGGFVEGCGDREDESPIRFRRSGGISLPEPVIRGRFPGEPLAVLARVTRGERLAAIVWIPPAPPSAWGEVVAVAFQRRGLRWLPIGERVALGTGGGAALAALLGGEDFAIERTCGLPLDELAPAVDAALQALAAALDRGDREAAAAAYGALAPAVAFEPLALAPVIEAWIAEASAGGATGPLTVELVPGDGDWFEARVGRGRVLRPLGRLPWVRCAGGWALGGPLG